jgi:hypothetical protein
VLREAGVRHVAHGEDDPVSAAARAAGDGEAVAFIGPFRSRAVAEAVEATAPAGLLLLAPVATWAGITRDDEPGCEDDPADHRGTVLRMVARDTEVARHLGAYAREHGPAWVVAGTGEYGTQLDGQLRLVGLPRARYPDEAGFALLAGVADEPGMERARETDLPVIGFDGVQGLDLGAGRDVRVALPFAKDPTHGIEAARAARLVVAALAGGATTRAEVLAACRAAGPFDNHGDPVDPPVWLWRADERWRLTPEQAI